MRSHITKNRLAHPDRLTTEITTDRRGVTIRMEVAAHSMEVEEVIVAPSLFFSPLFEEKGLPKEPARYLFLTYNMLLLVSACTSKKR